MVFYTWWWKEKEVGEGLTNSSQARWDRGKTFNTQKNMKCLGPKCEAGSAVMAN